MASNTVHLTPKVRFAHMPLGISIVAGSPQPPSVLPMFTEQAWAEIARSLRLSGRELQILHGVFRNDTESAIAAALCISSHTVHTHFERLYRKLGVSDRIALILRVVEVVLTLTNAPGTALSRVCSNFAAGRCPLPD